MKIFLLVCLLGMALALNRKQLNGLRRLLSNLDTGIYPTCNIIFFSEMVDYDTADQKCKNFQMGTATSQQGLLATVNDEEKNKDLQLLLEEAYPLGEDKDKWGPNKWVWAGLRKTQNNAGEANSRVYNPIDWTWADGTHPIDYKKWFSKQQPDQKALKYKKQGCKEQPKCYQNQMRINHAGKWDDTFKHKIHPYACDYQGKYIMSASLKTWPKAREACEDAGLNFAKIRNLGELAEIEDAALYFLGPRDETLREFDATNWFWVGGTDQSEEGVWRWDDGEAIDTSWMPFRRPNPDDAQYIGETGQDGLAISKWAKFDDSFTSRRKRPFACQCPGT